MNRTTNHEPNAAPFAITPTGEEGRALLNAGEAEAKRRGLANVGELLSQYLAAFTPKRITADHARARRQSNAAPNADHLDLHIERNYNFELNKRYFALWRRVRYNPEFFAAFVIHTGLRTLERRLADFDLEEAIEARRRIYEN